jgi:hemolysin-activating ACP:hemolysin acyltransferase
MRWGKDKSTPSSEPPKAADIPSASKPAPPPAAAVAAPPPASATVTGSANGNTAEALKSNAADMLKAKAIAAQQQQFAQLFSQAIAVLMRDANYKNLPLRELEFLLPPIMVGQCAVANSKITADGPAVPVALALWARVSPSVDQRLSQNLDKSIELKPNEWTSGNIPWLITIAGSTQVLSTFIKQLCDKEFPGQPVKMRAADKEGVRSVQVLQPGAPAGV